MVGYAGADWRKRLSMPGEDPCPAVCSVSLPRLREPTATTAELANSKASPGVSNLFASTIFQLPIMN